ncbi:MAG: helix-turn-helix transcriptional regulator [Gemmatimonadota bacterium]|nr:MAG: helix-turn-helix transcriptional regulator [Gemmatimonadota bacterium]
MGKGEYLGEFEQLVMLALVRLGKVGYGMTVRRELEATSGRSVSIGAVYATLDRLEAKGYLSSSVGDPEPVRGGRGRRTFTMEPDGLVALARSRAVLDKMWDGVRLSDLDVS